MTACNKPKRPCCFKGCKNYQEIGSYCKEHYEQRKRAMIKRRFEWLKEHSARTNSNDKGYNSAWSRASKAYLKQHPLCAECMRHGILTPATEVDHIIPHKGNKDLFWDSSNWQSLCHSCHSKKTFNEDNQSLKKIFKRS